MQSPASVSALLRRFREEPPKPPSQRKAAPVEATSSLSADAGSPAPTAVGHARSLTHAHTPSIGGGADRAATTLSSSTPSFAPSAHSASPSLRRADNGEGVDDTQRVLERARAVIASSRKMFEAGVIPGLEAMSTLAVAAPGRGGDRQREAGASRGLDGMSSAVNAPSALRSTGGDISGGGSSARPASRSAELPATRLTAAAPGSSLAPMPPSSTALDADALWRASEVTLSRADDAAASVAISPSISMQMSASALLARESVSTIGCADESSPPTGITRVPPDADILASLGDTEWKQRLLAGAHIGAVATDNYRQRTSAPDDVSAGSRQEKPLQSVAVAIELQNELPRHGSSHEAPLESAAIQRPPSPLHAVAMAIQQVSHPLIPEITLPTDFIIPHAHVSAHETMAASSMGAPMGSRAASTLRDSSWVEHDLYPDVATIQLEDPEITIQRLRQRLARIDEESGLFAAAAPRSVAAVQPRDAAFDRAPGAHAQTPPYAYMATAMAAPVDSGHAYVTERGHLFQSVQTTADDGEPEAAERHDAGAVGGSSTIATRRADACVGTESPLPWATPPVTRPSIQECAEAPSRPHGECVQSNASAPKLGACNDVQPPKPGASGDIPPATAPTASLSHSTGATAVVAAPIIQIPPSSAAIMNSAQTDIGRAAPTALDDQDEVDANNRVARRGVARSSLRDSVALSLDSLDWHLSDEDEPVLRQPTKIAVPIPNDSSSNSGPLSSTPSGHQPSNEDEQGTEPLPSSTSAVAASGDNLSGTCSGTAHTPGLRTVETSSVPSTRTVSLHTQSRVEVVASASKAHHVSNVEKKGGTGQHPRNEPVRSPVHSDAGAAVGSPQYRIVPVDTIPPLQVRAASPSSRCTDGDKPHTVVLVVTNKQELADVLSTLGVAGAPLDQSTVAAPSIAEVSVHTDDSAAHAGQPPVRRLEPPIQRMPAAGAQVGLSRAARTTLAAINSEEQHLLALLDDDPLYHQLLREAQRRRTASNTHVSIVSHP